MVKSYYVITIRVRQDLKVRNFFGAFFFKIINIAFYKHFTKLSKIIVHLDLSLEI